MNERELKMAVEPVLEYFSGRELNPNTVLAAYLRAWGLPASGQPWHRAKQALGEGASFEEAVAVAGAEPEVGTAPLAVPRAEEPTPFVGTSLGWYAKQFGPGDLDGVGARRLLGTPDMEPAALLVRETAQNSWDARGISSSIDFTLNLRRLGPETIRLLRERIFTGGAPGTGLRQLLDRRSFWALEVSDRGTVGLGGPIRNDLAVDSGEDTNFIDLVFNVGAPRDVHLGGGTYGFGKTISYVVSEVGTVLIWTSCEGSREIEQRLIGSAIGDAFDMNGFRYTGRHWWGNAIATEDRVEPVVGPLAQELGQAVFSQKFDKGSTGTSMLILAPRLGGNSPEESIKTLSEGIVWNLWPKLMRDQAGRSRMNISLQLNGEEICMPVVEEHGSLSGHIDCLRAIRATQKGEDASTLGAALPVSVIEIRSERPRKLLGHLALTRYPVPKGTKEPSQWVTLMRNQAELVVKYLRRTSLDVDGFQWAGVFKPVPEVDDSFALAEPPAHDDWVAQAVQDKAKRRDVNIALDRIKSHSDAFIRPYSENADNDKPIQSAAVAGDALAGLLGGILGSAPGGGTRARGGGGQRAVRPRAEIVASGVSESGTPGWIRTWLDVQLSNSAKSLPVQIRVLVGVDGGSETDPRVITVLGWLDASTEHYLASGEALLAPDEVMRFEFESRADLAIDVDVRIVER